MACNRHLLPAAGLLLLNMVLRPCGGLAQGVLEEVPFDQKLVPGAPAADAFGDRFGVKLALAGDTLVVGASTANVGGRFFVGAADLFLRDAASGTWAAPRRLLAEDGAAFDQFGGAGVAVAGDEVFLGVPLARVDGVLQQGAVYVFARDAGGTDAWGQAAKLTDPSVGSIGHLGSSIAVDGNLMAVGASRGGGGNGQVTIFERDRGGPGIWGVAGSVSDAAVADGGLPLETFGSAVALEGDLLLVGAPSADVSFFREDDGAAYLFRRDALFPDQWDFVTRLTDPSATVCPGGLTLAEVSLEGEDVQAEVERCALEEGRTDRDGFGASVAFAGDTIVVASPGAEAASGEAAGAVFVFRRDPANADAWSVIARLQPSDLAASSGPGFGAALAFDGDAILAGAPGSEVGAASDQGAVYQFDRNEGGPDAWGETRKLVAGDGLAGESFGVAIAMDGLDGIIGASGYDQGHGAAYLTADVPLVVEPLFPPIGELADASVLDGPSGVLIGAPANTLDSPAAGMDRGGASSGGAALVAGDGAGALLQHRRGPDDREPRGHAIRAGPARADRLGHNASRDRDVDAGGGGARRRGARRFLDPLARRLRCGKQPSERRGPIALCPRQHHRSRAASRDYADRPSDPHEQARTRSSSR